MENARADIATRILKRMVYKRNDFAQFYKCLNGEQLFNLTNSLKEFITNVVRCVNNTEKVSQFHGFLSILDGKILKKLIYREFMKYFLFEIHSYFLFGAKSKEVKFMIAKD